VNLTDEQVAYVDLYRQAIDLVVEAGAGTGKSSTLKAGAHADPRRAAYIAYNRSTADDARKSFPWHVEANTAHGFASRAVGRRYMGRRNASAKQPAKVTAEILARLNRPAFEIGLDAGLHRTGLARLTMRTLGAWCKSAEREVLACHVPETPQLRPDERRGAVAAAVMLAATAWQDLQHDDQSGKGELPFEHDHYLKMWALTNPRLPVDVVMFDEAQDANPVMAGVVEGQTHAQRVAVGDRCQAINGWNGAVDAMSGWPWHRLTLSQSFRFGPAVADVANLWLDALDGPVRLRGYDVLDTRVGYCPEPTLILCRGNVAAIVAADREVNDGRRVAMAGGVGEVKRLAFAARDLQAGRPTDHPQLYLFNDWDALREYAEDDGSDLLTFVKLIDRFGTGWVLRVCADLVRESESPDVVVSTVHKAKGRESANVLISGDFPEPGDVDKSGKPVPFTREDGMLAYVAVTRARELLDLGGLAWIQHTKPVFTDGTDTEAAA
jgi:hypothetical protein